MSFVSENCTIKLPEYLINELDKIAKLHNLTKYTIKCESGSEHGAGFMATMISIKLIESVDDEHINELSDKSVKRSIPLICKLLPENPARRIIFSAQKAFEREVYMYNKVLPEFDRFQQEKGIISSSSSSELNFFEYPNCYFACSDRETDQHVIIMDDLRSKGFFMWNKFEPHNIESTSLFMAALGKFHGLSFALRDQQPKLFETFKSMDDIMLNMINNSPGMEDLFNSGYKKAIELVESDNLVHGILSNIQLTWKERFHKCCDLNAAEPFAIVGHGDCWNNNMMFRGNEEICLVDWQLGRVASPVMDITYFLLSSTTKQLRDKYFDKLLEIYYENLVNICKKCGSNPNELFKFSDLKMEFERFSDVGIIMAPLLLKLIVTESKNIGNVDKYAEKQIDNKDSQQTLTQLTDETTEIYKNRLIDSIRDAVSLGWIKLTTD